MFKAEKPQSESMDRCHYNTEFDVEVVAWDAQYSCVDGGRYVTLPDRSEYSLRLRNLGPTEADVEVEIDGLDMGDWRVHAHSSILIDRPSHQARKFTFVSETGAIARETGNIPGKEENGLIRVTFRPGKEHVQIIGIRRTFTPLVGGRAFPKSAMRASPMESARFTVALPPTRGGVTVLGDESSQRFQQVSALDEYDYERTTVIMIRLQVRGQRYVHLRGTREGVYPRRLDQDFL